MSEARQHVLEEIRDLTGRCFDEVATICEPFRDTTTLGLFAQAIRNGEAGLTRTGWWCDCPSRPALREVVGSGTLLERSVQMCLECC